MLQQLSQQGVSFDPTTADRTSVDGARSFGYHASQHSTGLEPDVYAVREREVSSPAAVTRSARSAASGAPFGPKRIAADGW